MILQPKVMDFEPCFSVNNNLINNEMKQIEVAVGDVDAHLYALIVNE